MIKVDESAFICDMAETYHIYDWRSLPIRLVATLAAGLRDNSRIVMKLRGEKMPRDEFLLGVLCDRVGLLITGLAGEKKAPPSIIESIYGDDIKKEKRKNSNIRAFSSIEEFEKERNKLLGKEI